MKPFTRLVLGTIALLAAGCSFVAPPVKERAEVNAALVNRLHDAAIRNAILAQHTLYDYHFVKNAATLNSLGRHDVDVLTAHYKDHPGPLNIRQGGVPAELYDARVQEITRLLVEAGVDKARITVADALPGGEGMASERVLQIIEHEGVAKPRAKSPSKK